MSLRFRHAITVLMLGVMIASVFLAACRVPTPTPTLPPPTSTVAPADTATPQKAPTHTATPLMPPTVVSRVPARGEEWKPNQQIIITFDQPMDEGSVKAAFSIQPPVEGTLSLRGNELIFTPAKPLERGKVYTVNIASTAKSAAGLPLGRDLSYRVQTVGYLEVTTVQPANNTQDVAPDTLIMAVFNRPVVPLTAVESQKNLPQPIIIEPPVKGEGAWINTSIYAFRPSEPLASATIYRATIKAGLADASGGVLAQDFTWSFSTTQPKVLTVSPKAPPKGQPSRIRPTEPISVTFNVPMDRASTEAAFRLTPAGKTQPVDGMFKWDSTGKNFTFTPARPLEYGVEYTATLLAGAKSAVGSGRIAAEQSWNFTVVSLPRVLRTTPRDGDRNVEVSGGVEFWFTAPVLEKTLAPNLTILPKPASVYTYYSEYDARLWISFDREPQTDYTVTLGAQVADAYGNTLPAPYTLRFRTGDLPAGLYLNTAGIMGTYNTYTETRVTVTYQNISSVSWSLYRLPLESFIAIVGERTSARQYQPSSRDLIRQGVITPDAPRNKSQILALSLGEKSGSALEPGLYFLTVTAPEIVRTTRDWRPPSHILIVSPYHMVLKSGGSQALVWVTDMATGQPVRGVPVTLLDHTGKQLGAGVTDAEGLFGAKFAPRDVWQPLTAIAGQPGERFGAVISQWNEEITPWAFNLPFQQYRERFIGHLYTDRPIYRPGQAVNFKGIIRKDDDALFTLPAAMQTISITVRDGEGNDVYQQSLPISAMGSFSGTLELAQGAALGYYYIDGQVALPDAEDWRIGASFQVAEYRKPEYEVSVKTDTKEYIHGDTINVTAQANYYFGGPVRNAKVDWTLLSYDYWFDYQGEGWYDFNDIDWWEMDIYRAPAGQQLAEGQATTDEQGRVSFTIPADISKQKLSQTFTIDVSITDVNDQQVSSRASVLVHKGAFYIGLRPKQYVSRAGEEAAVEIITVDPQSKPVSNVSLQVIAYATRWDNVQVEDKDGTRYWKSVVLETPVVTKTVSTDAKGMAIFSFTPEAGGTYKVRAIGRDARENVVRSSTNIWVSGRKDEFVSWRRENNNRINLVADKKEYNPGDTAYILIPSPFQGTVRALVTVERGKLLEQRVISLSSNSEQIAIRITEDYIPNVFVSVVIVKGQDATEPLGAFRIGYIKLPVSSESKKLKIELSTDKPAYQPRQEAVYKIRATDWMGKPVQAELSLSLVDLSVLALGGADQGDLFQTFWRERGVGFYTASSMVVAVDRITKAVTAERAGAKGGGGGGGAGMEFVRSEFADTAYWKAAIMTDQNGEASVTVKLPDNLTTWRMEARAITLATQVGVKTHDVVSTKPLLARPVLPRFFVIGDQGQISGIVHNNTDQAVEATVSIALTGLQTKDPLEQKVKIGARDLAKLSWNVSVQNATQARVRLSAQGAGLSDAVEMALPVYHPSTPEVVATAGQLDAAGQLVETIILPEVLDPSMGELTVTLDPSLAAGMQDGLKYLEHYPYECVEQTISRFLPNVVTYRALKQLGIYNAELETRLPQLVGAALQRIYAQQHYDGGWGWWISDESNDYLTAYVLYGLSEAYKAGFLVDKKVMERAARFLEDKLQAPRLVSNTWELNREVFKLYALANYSSVAGVTGQIMSRAVLLYDNREKMGLWAKALLANTFTLLDPKETSRVNTLLGELTSKAIVSATGAHWEEETADYHNMNSDTRTTSIVLSAIARHDPKHGLGPNAVRWLMSVRKEGRWESTYETVWALLGLTDWMVATGELAADYRYSVVLNNQLLKEGTVNRSNVDQQVRLQTAVKDLLLDQANRLSLERGAGEGRLYYAASLKYYLPADKIKALDRGIVVSREYRLLGAPDKTITEAKVGDVIQVRLTIIAPNDLHYVVVEDPLPAGCEALDVSLRTTSATISGPSLEKPEDQTGPWWRRWWYEWWSPTHSELRDEKVVLFATYLSRGTYQYTYMMRASLPGRFLVIPTTAYEMYFPEVFGRSDGMGFTVGR